jgi:hypothetical protein
MNPHLNEDPGVIIVFPDQHSGKFVTSNERCLINNAT